MSAKTSEYTGTKQEDFHRILSLHTAIVKKVWNKYRWRPASYLYLDLYAGPGQYNDEHYRGPGSPLIAIEVFRRARIGYRCHLFNNDEAECSTLRASLNGAGLTSIHCGDNRITLPGLEGNNNILGLAYLDPNNVLPDFDMADHVQDNFKRLDILFYFGAAFDKRVRTALNRPIGEGYSLLERMRRIKKDKWLVKEPGGKQQYTFMLATNADIGDWKKVGWYDIDNAAGWEILNRLNYTNMELLHSNQARLI
jgi:hypothetical protein